MNTFKNFDEVINYYANNVSTSAYSKKESKLKTYAILITVSSTIMYISIATHENWNTFFISAVFIIASLCFVVSIIKFFISLKMLKQKLIFKIKTRQGIDVDDNLFWSVYYNEYFKRGKLINMFGGKIDDESIKLLREIISKEIANMKEESFIIKSLKSPSHSIFIPIIISIIFWGLGTFEKENIQSLFMDIFSITIVLYAVIFGLERVLNSPLLIGKWSTMKELDQDLQQIQFERNFVFNYKG